MNFDKSNGTSLASSVIEGDSDGGGSSHIIDGVSTKQLIRKLKEKSKIYLFHKFMQRFAILYYGKVVLSLVMILSIMCNTLFSLGYVALLCTLMYKN